MERAAVIKKFLAAGMQLDKDALEHFTKREEDIDRFLEFTRSGKVKPKIVTADIIRKGLNPHPDQPSSLDLKITELKSEKRKVSVNDVVKSLTEKYESLKEIIEERSAPANLVSINKISQNAKEFSIIATVVSAEDGTLTVEDTTGELMVKFGKEESILPDDVIGLVCERKDGTDFVKEAVWPDVPLKREIKKSKAKILCTFLGAAKYAEAEELKVGEGAVFVFGQKKKPDKALDTGKNKIIFLDEDLKESKGSESSFKPPLLAELSGISILVLSKELVEKYKKYWEESDVARNLLKRRSIDPVQDLQEFCSHEAWILKDVPDIVAFPGSVGIENYKGTTIISVSEQDGYSIDLSTREVKKL